MRQPVTTPRTVLRQAGRSARALLFGTAIAIAAIAIAACSPAGEESGSVSSSERQFLSLGSASPGATFYTVGGAIADVMTAAHPSWQVNNEATKGSQENIRRLLRGELDLAVSNAAITYFAVRGGGEWEQAYDVQSIMTLAPNVALFIAPASSGVKTIADLRGRRVIVGPAGAGFENFVRPIVEAHGLTFDDFTALNATQTAAVDQLSDGSAAAAFLGGAIPTASITQAATSMEVLFVPFDPAVRSQLVQDFPFFEEAVIPAGTYRGLERDYEGLNVGSMHLIVAASAPESLVYEMTKAIWDHRSAVVERHPAGRAINERNAARDSGTPFHPGAIRFYREIGIWPESDAAAPDAASGDPQ
jgi:hypothetical protein